MQLTIDFTNPAHGIVIGILILIIVTWSIAGFAVCSNDEADGVLGFIPAIGVFIVCLLVIFILIQTARLVWMNL